MTLLFSRCETNFFCRARLPRSVETKKMVLNWISKNMFRVSCDQIGFGLLRTLQIILPNEISWVGICVTRFYEPKIVKMGDNETSSGWPFSNWNSWWKYDRGWQKLLHSQPKLESDKSIEKSFESSISRMAFYGLSDLPGWPGPSQVDARNSLSFPLNSGSAKSH